MMRAGLLLVWIIGWAMAFAAVTPAQLVDAARERTLHSVTYDGRYFAIEYPGGDVPATIGVCTDVVICSYRTLA